VVDASRALFLTLFLFGLLTWFYTVAIQITEPGILPAPLTHIDIFPFNIRVDVAGIVAFAVSALSFFLWRLTLTSSGTAGPGLGRQRTHAK
jgi:hypothetical protein